MVAPAQAMLVALLFLPALYVFWLSLTRSTYGATPEWVGPQQLCGGTRRTPISGPPRSTP
jgi:ABC-type sugar transport system permease subunit